MSRSTWRRILSVPVVGLVIGAGTASAPPPETLRIGAVFPLTGVQAPLAQQEFRGIEIARDMVNRGGGVRGMQIQLDTRSLSDPSQAAYAITSLANDKVPAIIGTYSSSLSIPASAAASRSGITYWEAGAVADQVTGRGLPGVFRIGASGTTLGGDSATFTATQLAPRLHRSPADVRVAVVYEDDPYGNSVADAAIATARASGLPVVDVTPYNAYFPQWGPVLSSLTSSRPDVIILASYIFDGAAFREAMLAAHLHVAALIGSTMAECYPDFGDILGPDAVGVFASDRPDGWVNYSLLSPSVRSATDQFTDAWRTQTGTDPTEEGLAGFTAGWALFHDVLPRATSMTSAGISDAAQSTVLPAGSLPNGGGIRFSQDPSNRGQNVDAIGVMWQWQSPFHEVTVWPPPYAMGTIKLFPLPR